MYLIGGAVMCKSHPVGDRVSDWQVGSARDACELLLAMYKLHVKIQTCKVTVLSNLDGP
jgi:hypothetical protein